MLMQNFKSAAELRISESEQAALIKVLGMLERGDLRDVEPSTPCDDGFNMGTTGKGCGTPACIGGWAALLMGIDQSDYLDQYSYNKRDKNPAINNLFWNEDAIETGSGATVSQAATALRSYLTTGDARWDLAVA